VYGQQHDTQYHQWCIGLKRSKNAARHLIKHQAIPRSPTQRTKHQRQRSGLVQKVRITPVSGQIPWREAYRRPGAKVMLCPLPAGTGIGDEGLVFKTDPAQPKRPGESTSAANPSDSKTTPGRGTASAANRSAGT
jgi:hypothetical protein